MGEQLWTGSQVYGCFALPFWQIMIPQLGHWEDHVSLFQVRLLFKA